ncbi:MAG: aminotransferase class V-fold PLP-dependent enzyme [Pseudomonadota bacterium]
MSTPKLDLEFTRAQFPAFAENSLKGQAFFENAGGSYTSRHVIDRLLRFYKERKVQPYAPYQASTLGGAEMDAARDRLAALMGVQSDQLSFGPSTSQNTYVLAQAFREILSAGDAIIVTNQDHEANSGVWRRLDSAGIEIREWKMDPATGHLPLEALDHWLDGKVKLVCFPHCSNIVGEINDVAAITKRARDAGAFTCVDGVSYAPHGFPNIGDLGADAYLFSSYKTYGPHQGIMVLSDRLNAALPNQAHFFNSESSYKRFTPAGPDHAQIAACAGMADYIDALYAHHFGDDADAPERNTAIHDLMRAAEIENLQPVLDMLSAKNSVRLLGPIEAAVKAPTVAVVTKEDPESLAAELSNHGIMCGGGDFYAVRCIEGQGEESKKGVLRLSFVHYTSKEEIDQLLSALDQVL